MKLLYVTALALASFISTPATAQVEGLVPATEPVNSTTRAKAFWLILKAGISSEPTLIAVPTDTLDQCEMSGAAFLSSKRLQNQHFYTGFECIEGIR